MLTCQTHDNTVRSQPNERLDCLFEERCHALARTGDGGHPAVIAGDSVVSYPELDRQANRIARFLLMQGVKAGDRVGVLLSKTVSTYASLLAVLKINAAYVPLDASFPRERLAFIVKDAEVHKVITLSDYAYHLEDIPASCILLDEAADLIDAQSSARLSDEEKGRAEDQLCYIVYTSGSTGNPKGVAIEHPSICNFVKVAAEVYGIRREDRVYQGMTIAFDFSVEEIWVPLMVGATLVPALPGAALLGKDLADFLHDRKITALCCVPTLLATIERDLPDLRFLLVSGEACPHDLIVRWHRPGRTILNAYGPTETTVTATLARLHPGRPVTIGAPLPTYYAVILDENRNEVPRGESGEICIAGVCLAKGYLNQPELTAKSFIPDFLDIPNNPSKRIYRTGDLGRITDEGEIEYLGRIDTQVKIRGYRIELSEIESVLLQVPEIAQAVVSTHAAKSGMLELVAYCTLKDGVSELPYEEISRTLRSRLPGYMIPAYIEKIAQMPMLPSNKVDRKKLPMPVGPRFVLTSRDFVAPETEIERAIAAAIAGVLKIEDVSVEDDFFEDLGGHSLVVAQVVSQLRKLPELSVLGLIDFYKYPTVRKLAEYVAQSKAASVRQAMRDGTSSKHAAPAPQEEVYRASSARVWLCGAAQLAFTAAYATLFAIPPLLLIGWGVRHPIWRSPVDWQSADFAIFLLTAIAYVMGLGIALGTLSLLMPIAVKWLVLGRVKEGRHELWGWYFFRWSIVQNISAMSPLLAFKGTAIINFYYWLMGAKIGEDSMIFGTIAVADLIEIGSRCSIGTSRIAAYEIRNGFLHFRKITIGDECYVGSNSIVMPGGVMEPGSWLGDQSLLPSDGVIPRGESWAGSPAEKEDELNRNVLELRRAREQAKHRHASYAPGFRITVGMVAAAPIYAIATFLSGLAGIAIILASYFYFGGVLYALLSAPVAALAFVVTLCLGIAFAKWLILPRIEEGIYEVNSSLYLRKLIADNLVAMTLVATHTLYATLYLPPFLRMLGAKIGRRSEISTVTHVTPELLDVGEECFLADIVNAGPLYAYMGYFGVKRTRIARRSFIGNAAFVPAGTRIGKECLIGVLSKPVTRDIPDNSSWFGSPAFYLPRRQQSQAFDEALLYAPTPALYVKRLIYEYFRITLPHTLYAVFFVLFWYLFIHMLLSYPLWASILLLPWVVTLSGVGLGAVVVALKWLFMGRYVPRVEPLWSMFCRRTELITGLYESVVVPILMIPLAGTPFVPLVLRAFGVKVGKRCYLETNYVTEFDLVEIGDDCSIAAECSLQTHLFEDRVMKMSHVRLGNGCSVGPRAVILYDTKLEDEVDLDALSLVMKGEVLPARTKWRGSPANSVSLKRAYIPLPARARQVRLLDAKAAFRRRSFVRPGAAASPRVTMKACRSGTLPGQPTARPEDQSPDAFL